MNRSNRRKKRKEYSRKILLLIVLVLFILVINKTFSRFSSAGKSAADVDVAFYILEEKTMSENIVLRDIQPGWKQDYTFSVANNDGTSISETAMQYTIAIRTTTNLPLKYKLYKNNEESAGIVENKITKDEDGVYYRIINFQEEQFGIEKKEENIYKIEITLPEEYNESKYQNILETIELKIDSKQII